MLSDLVTELFLRNPLAILAKNFETSVSAFNKLPSDQRYIFNGSPTKMSLEDARASVEGPAGGRLPENESYSYHLSTQQPMTVPGGSLKIVDPTTFPIANNFSVGLFAVEPGAMRELHWHLTSDEWSFFISGTGRQTIFTGPTNSRTFDFQAGDVGYVTSASSHYVENTGNETLVYLEILQAPRYQDLSAAQWLGLTPKQVVKETLNLDDEFVNHLPKTKRYIVPGNRNLSTTNFTRASYPDAELNATAMG
jgi:oxalate decarboxylase family bicupin protein